MPGAARDRACRNAWCAQRFVAQGMFPALLLSTASVATALTAVIGKDAPPRYPGYGFVVFFVALEAIILALTA